MRSISSFRRRLPVALALTFLTACVGGGSDKHRDGASCTTASDCTDEITACQLHTCVDGACGVADVDAGTATADPTSGDCHAEQCDGAGGVITVVDDADLPDDANPCTVDACAGGAPSHTNVASGTSCGDGLVCNGSGRCVGCTDATQCPGSDTACQARTCTDQVCGVLVVAEGTFVSDPTPGDCQADFCDGKGGQVSSASNTDVPPDGTCTTGVCRGGTPHQDPVAARSSCGVGLLCDGAGSCVGCLADADCAPASTCASYLCSAGTCEPQYVAAGTLVSNPIAGDCHALVCDGAGNTVSAVDDTDVPVDGNACTEDACASGTPRNPALPARTNCGAGLLCDEGGNCLECLVASDCTSGVCNASGACAAPTCGDTVKNGSETDVDCGGSCGATCAAGATCRVDADCATGACTGGVCVGCFDGVRDGAEAGVDCGGSCANGCAEGTACTHDTDCAGSCLSGNCKDTAVVVRVGNGTNSMYGSSLTRPVTLIRYALSNGAILNSVALPATASGANLPFTLEGNVTNEGTLSRSADGHYLTLAGYATGEGTSGVSGLQYTIARIGTSYAADTSTAADGFGSTVNCAATQDGSRLWIGGSINITNSSYPGGLRTMAYGSAGAATSVFATQPDSVRACQVVGGALYLTAVQTGSSSYPGLYTIPSLPTDAATPTKLFATADSYPSSFLLLDTDSTSGVDTAYVAASTGYVRKYRKGTSTWSATEVWSAMPAGTTGAVTGLTGWVSVSGGVRSVVLVVSTNTQVYKATDAPASITAPTFSSIATSSTNYTYFFRGAAPAPR